MKPLQSIIRIVLVLFTHALTLCREIWLLLTDMIGDEDYDDQENSPSDNAWYNHRTGETTSYQQSDGIYNSSHNYDQ